MSIEKYTKRSVGSLVKCLREKAGLSQQAFATQLGVALNTINRYETGSKPDLPTAVRLAGYAAKLGEEEIAKDLEQFIGDTWDLDVLIRLRIIGNDAGRGSLLALDTYSKLTHPHKTEEMVQEALDQLREISRVFVNIRKSVNAWPKE